MSISIWKQLAGALSSAGGVTTTPLAPRLPVGEFVKAIEWSGGLLVLALVVLAFAFRRQLHWAKPRWQIDDDDNDDESRSVAALWVGALVMVWCFLAMPMALSALRTRALGEDGAAVVVYGGTCVGGLCAVALLHGLWWPVAALRILGVTPLRKTFLPGRAAAGVLVAVPWTNLVAAISLLAWQQLGWQHASAHAILQLMGRSEGTRWIVGLAVVNATLLAPMFEETLFRGHLQTALTRALPRSRWPAIVITSLIFASIHDAWSAVPIFALSVAIGVAYEWSGSLWVAIAIHVGFNATSTLSFLTER